MLDPCMHPDNCPDGLCLKLECNPSAVTTASHVFCGSCSALVSVERPCRHQLEKQVCQHVFRAVPWVRLSVDYLCENCTLEVSTQLTASQLGRAWDEVKAEVEAELLAAHPGSTIGLPITN